MNKKHRKAMEDLKAAKPRLPPDVESWAEGESAKEILAQILATEAEPERPPSTRRSSATRRIAWGALVVVLVGVGAFLAVHFLSGSGRDEVVSHPTNTSSVSSGPGSVSAQQALEEIIALIQATPSTRRYQMPPISGGKMDLVQEARALGLLSSSESSSIQLGQPATRKQFALWLWRGFGSVLPKGSATAKVSDLSLLTPEEQQAVEGLVKDGVVELPQNGAFGGDQVLTSSEGSALQARVKALVQGPSSS